MKHRLSTAIILTVFGALFLTAGAAAKTDYSGSWKLDPAKTEGLPPGMEQSMSVKQNGDEIKLETRVKTPNGEFTDTDSYRLDGKPVELTKTVQNSQKQKIKRTAQWTEGGGLKIRDDVEIEAPDGSTATVVFRRQWTLSADGKTLVIEIDAETPQGNVKTKRTFVRA